mmetsp:Transcript_643/g.1887  ORF Transcript_643/g.1887 Transcript_643/m.1887 type:complete len:279 (+) Transcript_643:815-1651(+)
MSALEILEGKVATESGGRRGERGDLSRERRGAEDEHGDLGGAAADLAAKVAFLADGLDDGVGVAGGEDDAELGGRAVGGSRGGDGVADGEEVGHLERLVGRGPPVGIGHHALALRPGELDAGRLDLAHGGVVEPPERVEGVDGDAVARRELSLRARRRREPRGLLGGHLRREKRRRALPRERADLARPARGAALLEQRLVPVVARALDARHEGEGHHRPRRVLGRLLALHLLRLHLRAQRGHLSPRLRERFVVLRGQLREPQRERGEPVHRRGLAAAP